MTMKLKFLSKTIRLLVQVVCTVCFLVLAYESITKYIDKPTSVSVTYLPTKTQKVSTKSPFCSNIKHNT